MTRETPVILVIIGVTGDLARKKVLPAIEDLGRAGSLPRLFKVMGITRQKNIAMGDVLHPSQIYLREHLELLSLDIEKQESYDEMASHLLQVEAKFGAPAQRLFSLSVPPDAVTAIVEKIGVSALATVPNTKLLLEKPFGTDFASATALMEHINRYFTESQVYRIDHYLAKEFTQSISFSREGIEKIEIVASESIGIESRARFYEQTGALRDVLQSHLLELAAITLAAASSQPAPERRLAALKKLKIASNANGLYAERGQYEGYRNDVGNDESVVETFVSLTLESEDLDFVGVPIRLVTGKQLATKTTEIRIFFKNGTTTIFTDDPTTAPNPYGSVLLAAIDSNRDLFVSREEVLETWRIIAPVLEAWTRSSADLFLYSPGTSEPQRRL